MHTGAHWTFRRAFWIVAVVIASAAGHLANCPSANPVAHWVTRARDPVVRARPMGTYSELHCDMIGRGFNGRAAVFPNVTAALHSEDDVPATLVTNDTAFAVDVIPSFGDEGCFEWWVEPSLAVYGVIMVLDWTGSGSEEEVVMVVTERLARSAVEYVVGEQHGTACPAAGATVVGLEFCYAPAAEAAFASAPVHTAVAEVPWSLAVRPAAVHMAACTGVSTATTFTVIATAGAAAVTARRISGRVTIANRWADADPFRPAGVWAVNAEGEALQLGLACGDEFGVGVCEYSADLPPNFVPIHLAAVVPDTPGVHVAGVDCIDVPPAAETTYGTAYAVQWATVGQTNATSIAVGSVPPGGVAVVRTPVRVVTEAAGTVAYEAVLSRTVPSANLSTVAATVAATFEVMAVECW